MGVPTMITLTEFLLARIAEDEAESVHDVDCSLIVNGRPDPAFGWECDCGWPDRLKAECEAKRRIVERHQPEEFADTPGEFFCSRCQRTAEVWPCPDVMDLALPYADHPDYREEWRP